MDCEAFEECHAHHSRVRAGMAIISSAIMRNRTCIHTLLLFAHLLVCYHYCKAGLCRAQFQLQLLVGHAPSWSSGCGEGETAQASKSLRRRCAILGQSRAEWLAGNCVSDTDAIGHPRKPQEVRKKATTDLRDVVSGMRSEVKWRCSCDLSPSKHVKCERHRWRARQPAQLGSRQRRSNQVSSVYRLLIGQVNQ